MDCDLAISAIICTHNRADYLPRAIQSLVDQTLNADQYEIIVVDNASTDGTVAVVDAIAHWPHVIRYCHEPQLGLSHARNHGYHQARGQYVAYLDDDAIASPDWLAAILAAWHISSPQVGLMGGKVLPIWEGDRPPWLRAQLLPYLSVLDLASTPVTLNAQQYVVGANMTLPKALLAEIGGFQVGLGRRGKNLLSDEEFLLKQQLEVRGYVTRYQPSLVVHHHIPRERLQQRWFLKRFFWQGVSKALTAQYLTPLSWPTRWQLSWSTTPHLRARFLKLPLLLLAGFSWFIRRPLKFQADCDLASDLGYVWGLLWIVNWAAVPNCAIEPVHAPTDPMPKTPTDPMPKTPLPD